MDEATLARALEPFFTTKPIGKESGHGLPMVQGFAAQSGGTVRISSRVGEGTRVELWLPQAMEPAAAATEEPPRPSGAVVAAAVHGSPEHRLCCPRILPCDNDADVRRMAASRSC